MNRRQFLSNTAFGALALSPLAKAAQPLTAQELYESRLSSEPWRRAWTGLSSDLATSTLKVTGRFPAEVVGSLYRNGPARLALGGQRYSHWFDGDGMVHQYRISPDRVTHQGRFVRTEKFNRETEAGRFLFDGAGSKVANAQSARNNDTINPANISVLSVGDELYALWEAGSAYQLNPETLETVGIKNWRDDLEHVPFSAHPIKEADGSIWNFGSLPWSGESGLMVIWRVSASGQLMQVKPINLPRRAYQHAFAMSERYLLFFLPPLVKGPGDTFVDSLHWQPDLGSRLLVVSKSDLEPVREFELPPGFVFHFGNACERNGEIELQCCWYEDGRIVSESMREVIEGVGAGLENQSRMATLRFDLKSGKSAVAFGHSGVEFPVFDARYVSQPQPYVYTTGRSHSATPGSDSVVRHNIHTGAVSEYCYGSSCLVDEHLFIPKAGAKPGQGWLLGTVLDYQREQSFLSVIDSEAIGDGPVATAWLNQSLPLGFHGTFVAGA